MKKGKPKKKFISLRHSRQKFNSFLVKSGKLGFAPISLEREARNQRMQRVVVPDSPRIADLAGQVILQKQVDDLTIRVIPGYDPKAHKFTKAGKFWVRITTLSKKGKEEVPFTWKTTRTGDFLERALCMMEMLAIALEHRPADPSNRTLLAKLEEWGHSYYHPFVWLARRGVLPQQFLTTGMLPTKRLQLFYDKWLKYRWYYENVARKKKGYKRREREVRRPYKRGVVRKESRGLE